MSIKLLALVSISRGKRWVSPTLKVNKSYMSLQELTVTLTPCRLFMESVVGVSTSIPAFFTFSIYRSMEFSKSFCLVVEIVFSEICSNNGSTMSCLVDVCASVKIFATTTSISIKKGLKSVELHKLPSLSLSAILLSSI